jgi:hypothetical protein
MMQHETATGPANLPIILSAIKQAVAAELVQTGDQTIRVMSGDISVRALST